ncbi:MAG: cytochrome c [Proteobacteria bacterium]|nr:cytochrome c [Pseudomonadota bacterium]
MREQWARRFVLITGLLILLLTTIFAILQNPNMLLDTGKGGEKDIVSERSEIILPDSKIIQSGTQVYKQQSCAQCHSIAGKGNPRNPLDDVGTKHNAEELRDWITGADALQGKLSGHVMKKKLAYRELSGDDLEALIIYMQSLNYGVPR